jgi:hypothetical protein
MSKICFAVALAGAFAPSTLGQNLVVIQGTDRNFYGSSAWTSMTSVIDNRFDAVSVVSNLTASSIENADALWIDHRGAFTALPKAELDVLVDYIASGRRVVFMGENVLWDAWNRPVLEALGGGFAGGTVFATATPTDNAPELTDGVDGVPLASAGIASGGVALFDQNWATLWGDNVLTLLDGDAFATVRFNQGVEPFATNVVNWLAVPNVATMLPLAAGMLAFSRRRVAP